MSMLTDIKYRIDQLDGGAFQNLCDAYLSCRGYGNGYSLGMDTGTDKTAKGNPDTYFLTQNHKYVFVMYTTQKTEFVKKALEDFQKCFDSTKTGIVPDDLEEIVYCHTYGRLSPGDDKNLHKYCETRNVVLTLVGLDTLGNDLLFKYPRLANIFLGISVDTGQISTIHEFIQAHDTNNLSAPLDTKFLLHAQELISAKEKLAQNDILIISGPSGTGKTKLALELCRNFSEHNDYEVLCIKSNGLELYNDLKTAIFPDRPYLILVDDANELTGLHFVLDFYTQSKNTLYGIKKLILTVRDYARYSIMTQILTVAKPELIKLDSVKDDDISLLLKENFEISNPLFVDRINYIAQGNIRLAMMAGKLANETQTLESIHDASEFYDNYYSAQIKLIDDNNTTIISAGIISFFQTLHLGNLENLSVIFNVAKISKDQFISDLKTLHEMEIVDLCHDMAVKISDQSLSNFLIKYIFVDKKAIPLYQMIETGFFLNQEKTISACNILFNIFSDKLITEYLEQQINLVWEHLKSDEEKFPLFFKAFHMIRPTDTLIYLQERIDHETIHSFDIFSIKFDSNDRGDIIDDDIISTISSFKNHLQLPEAIDLLLLYYKKRPDLFMQVYTALAFRFGIDKKSWVYDYTTQSTVVHKLCELVSKDASDNNLILLIRIAEQYLQFSFSGTEEGRQHSFTYYTIPLTMNDAVLEYRTLIFNQLYDIYGMGKCCTEIENLLMDYGNAYENDEKSEIIKYELTTLLSFFSLFSPENIFHCIIAAHINEVAQRVGYESAEILEPFLKSQKFEIYHTLSESYHDIADFGYHNYQERHKQQIEKLVCDYGLTEFNFLIQVCKECKLISFSQLPSLSSGIEHALEILFDIPALFIEVVKAYIEADTPYDIHIHNIISNLFRLTTAAELYELIMSYDFSQKNTWLWQFFVDLPDDQLSNDWKEELLDFLKTPPQNLRSSPFRDIKQIKKYECIDSDIIIKASRIISENYTVSPFVFSLYFDCYLNPCLTEIHDIIEQYDSEITLLEDIYLKYVSYSSHADHEGKLLAEIIRLDFDYLFCYLDESLKNRYNISHHNVWFDRLAFIWESESYLIYMTKISDYLYSQTGNGRYPYNFIINHMLLPRKNGMMISERQESWIIATIEEYHHNTQRMKNLFSAIGAHSIKRRMNALKKYLELNDDYSAFELLPLEASHWGGCGSLIPYMQVRINHLKSLLPALSGVKYLKHKRKVEEDIETWENRIRDEEIRELLNSL